MGKIHRLDIHVYRKIAAGEVIERPLSVVKELVENSLDAGADEIHLWLEKGGKDRVRVEDNGEGFAEEDIEMAFQRHSTSKVSCIEDLDRLSTLGFRGEALPSILEVADVRLKTANDSSGQGMEVFFSQGNLREKKGIPFTRGSSIEVFGLFQYLPVRKKFLKSDSSELHQIIRFLEQTALAHIGVTFSGFHNGKKIFSFPKTERLSERIYQVFGKEFADGLQEISFRQGAYCLEGYASRSDRGVPNKDKQFFLVNRRPVREKTLIAALNNTYSRFLEKGRFSQAVFQLTIPASDVDVNIHPMKLEVRFQDGNRIFSFIREAIERSLTAGTLPPADSPRYSSAPLPGEGQWSRRQNDSAESGFQQMVLPIPSFVKEEFTVFGQFLNSYIIAERQGKLLIVDQHNAHEKIIFERLHDESRRGALAVSPTLFPILLELSHSEKALLSEERIAGLAGSGFEIADLGGNTIEIRSFPSILEERLVKDVVSALLSLEAEVWKKPSSILATMACKNAVKVNHPLLLPEMKKILTELFALPNPSFCPHQRPVYWEIEPEEIEKKLRRR